MDKSTLSSKLQLWKDFGAGLLFVTSSCLIYFCLFDLFPEWENKLKHATWLVAASLGVVAFFMGRERYISWKDEQANTRAKLYAAEIRTRKDKSSLRATYILRNYRNVPLVIENFSFDKEEQKKKCNGIHMNIGDRKIYLYNPTKTPTTDFDKFPIRLQPDESLQIIISTNGEANYPLDEDMPFAGEFKCRWDHTNAPETLRLAHRND